jgi:hypothetical protein
MASAGARAARNREVRQRLDATLARIGKRLDVTFPPEPRRAKDPALQPILELERFADSIELIEVALGERANEGEAPGGYDTWTVAMLREEIATRELEAPSGARKADLVMVLEQTDALEKVEANEEQSEVRAPEGLESEIGEESEPPFDDLGEGEGGEPGDTQEP